MLVKRLTLAAGVETAFEFDEYAAKSVVVKNETADEIMFCDGPFDAAKAAHIPAFSWQALDVRMFPGEKPRFHVKAAAAGPVEVDLGSTGMGQMGNVLDIAGQVPHSLMLTDDDHTALAVNLTRLHGQTLDLDTPVALTSGATVFNGDIILVTPSADAGYYAKITINGVNYGRLEAGIAVVIDGETTIIAEAVALVEKSFTLTPGADTTLTAAATRLPGMLVDLAIPVPIATAEAIYVGEIIEFTAATTAGDGFHVTLTINDDPAELDTEGKVSVTVAADIVAVSASVADGGE